MAGRIGKFGGRAAFSVAWKTGARLFLVLTCAVAPVLGAAPATAESVDVVPTTLQESAGALDLRPRSLGSPTASVARTQSGPLPTAGAPASSGSLTDNPVVRTSLSLAVVLGLIFICAGAYRRFGAGAGFAAMIANPRRPNPAPAGILEILGRYPIARGQTLILLKLDRRVLLLSQTAPRIRGGAGSLATLAEITEPEDVASLLLKTQDAEGASQAAKFQSLLGRFDESHGGEPAAESATTLSAREVRSSEHGDRTEFWNERAVTSFPLIQPLAESGPAAADSFGSLKQRLTALQGEAHR